MMKTTQMSPEDELWLIPKQRQAIKPPFEPRSHFKMDFKSRLSMIVRRVTRSLVVNNRELKQPRRRRLRKRHRKSEFALPQTLSRVFHVPFLLT